MRICAICIPQFVCGCMNTSGIMRRIEERLQLLSYDKRHLLRIVLQGMVDIECEKNLDYLVNWLKDGYYFVRIRDNSGIRVDYDSFAADISLKGEFVRTVRAGEDMSEEDKGAIIRFGIQALAGEEIG